MAEQQHSCLSVPDFAKFESLNTVNLKFVELELDWPSEVSVFDLRNYILSKLMNYGEPLRWAITSLTNHSEKTIQRISIEAVFISNEDKTKEVNTHLN